MKCKLKRGKQFYQEYLAKRFYEKSPKDGLIQEIYIQKKMKILLNQIIIALNILIEILILQKKIVIMLI